jgi:hypothetical protein
MAKAVAYRDAHLNGFKGIQYDVELDSAFAAAREQMDRTVMTDCKVEIGGEYQKVEDISTKYRQVKYTLILLPMWFLSYTHNDRIWHAVINGYTGM